MIVYNDKLNFIGNYYLFLLYIDTKDYYGKENFYMILLSFFIHISTKFIQKFQEEIPIKEKIS